MTYYVTYKIDARYIAEVDMGKATTEEILAKAREAWEDANFGEAQDIDWEPVMVEDQDGNYIWEK